MGFIIAFPYFHCADVMCGSNTESKKGGVLLIHNKHFMTANGYSTVYHGFGGEDDDLALRYLLLCNSTIPHCFLNVSQLLTRAALVLHYVDKMRSMSHSKRA